MSLLERQKSNLVCWRLLFELVSQKFFLKIQLAELLHVLFMLSAAPVVWEGDPGLKLRDLVVKFSRWILGPCFLSSWLNKNLLSFFIIVIKLAVAGIITNEDQTVRLARAGLAVSILILCWVLLLHESPCPCQWVFAIAGLLSGSLSKEQIHLDLRLMIFWFWSAIWIEFVLLCSSRNLYLMPIQFLMTSLTLNDIHHLWSWLVMMGR